MHIVYRTENLIDGKFYYGVHDGSDDKYLGSGKHLKRAIDKYGKLNFIRRTIMEFNTSTEAYSFEKLIVDELLIKDPNCYNLVIGGKGGWEGKRVSQKGVVRTPEQIKRMSDAHIGIAPSVEAREKHRQNMIGNTQGFKKGDPSVFKGKKHTQLAKDKVSKANKGKIPWNKGLKGSQEAYNRNGCLDLTTGIFYQSLSEAALALGYGYTTNYFKQRIERL